MKRFFLPAITFLSILQAAAQDSTSTLENVTITANQLAQQQKETGRNIFSIKGDAFKKLPVHSVDELLRYLPGIEVQMRGPQGSQSDIAIRGGTFQQVLVIIDGVKLNDPLTGHFNAYIPIHPADIERIEILKGAASAIYGSEAVGGVINIITKTFAGKHIKGNSLQAKAVAGEYKLLNGDGFIKWGNEKTSIAAGVISNNAEGVQLRGTTSYFHLTTANLAFSHLFKNNWRISARTAADFRNFNAQNYYTSFASDTANEKVNSGWGQLNLSKKTNKGFFNADVAYKKLRDQYWFRPSAIPNDNKTNLLTAQAYYSSAINKTHSYTAGVQVHRKEIKSNDRGNHQLWHGALYTIFRQKIGNNVFLNESIRLDWDENYGATLVPQLNLAWSPSKITLRASAGRSIRDADFTERYNNYNKALVTGGSIGNPDLVAENSWNMEAGADMQLNKELKISGTAFYRIQKNIIDWTPTPYANMPRKINLSPTGNYALATNLASVNTAGVELDLQYNKKISSASSILFTAGYTWLDSKSKEAVPSFYISSHAKHLANFSAIYSIHAFTFSLNGIYKHRSAKKAASIGAEITPSYFIANAKLGYQPIKGLTVFLQADNIFNKTYSDLLGSKMPGRWLSGGIQIAL